MNNKLEKIMNMVDTNDLMTMVNEVNAWDSSLDYLNYIDMEEFDDYMEGMSATDIANMIHFGAFNPNDEYFSFNAYGNLISYNSWKICQELVTYKEDIVERFVELYQDYKVDMYNNEELKAILDSMLEAEE